MHTPLAVGLFLYCLTIVTCDKEQDTQSTSNSYGQRTVHHIESPAKHRRKRSKLAIEIGNAAIKLLRSRAQELRSYSKQWAKFLKNGNLDTAMYDFEKVRPKNVFKYKQGNGASAMIGDVGDRTIILKTKDPMEHGSPTIEVFDPKRAKLGPSGRSVSGQPSDKFVYKEIVKQPFKY